VLTVVGDSMTVSFPALVFQKDTLSLLEPKSKTPKNGHYAFCHIQKATTKLPLQKGFFIGRQSNLTLKTIYNPKLPDTDCTVSKKSIIIGVVKH